MGDKHPCHRWSRPSRSSLTWDFRVELMGLEPTTYWMQTSRSSQLSYSPASHSLGAAATRQMIPRSLAGRLASPPSLPASAQSRAGEEPPIHWARARAPRPKPKRCAPRTAPGGPVDAGLRHERPRSSSSSTITVTWARRPDTRPRAHSSSSDPLRASTSPASVKSSSRAPRRPRRGGCLPTRRSARYARYTWPGHRVRRS